MERFKLVFFLLQVLLFIMNVEDLALFLMIVITLLILLLGVIQNLNGVVNVDHYITVLVFFLLNYLWFWLD